MISGYGSPRRSGTRRSHVRTKSALVPGVPAPIERDRVSIVDQGIGEVGDHRFDAAVGDGWDLKVGRCHEGDA